jgi:hypothetical protein
MVLIPTVVSGSVFDQAWAFVKFDFDVEEELAEWTATTDPHEVGPWMWEHGNEEHDATLNKIAEQYEWHPNSTIMRWVDGPGKEKVQTFLNEQIRPGINTFGSQIREIPDWQVLMMENGIEPGEWVNLANQTVGNLSHTSKVGPSSGVPTAACQCGNPETKCGSCYAKNAERRGGTTVNRANWRHLVKLSENPILHAAAQAYLIDRAPEPTFRGNYGGDYQNVGHFAQALSIARRTPNKKHWLHTKEAPMLNEYLSQFPEGSQEWLDAIPENVGVRFSMPYDRMTVGPEGGGVVGDEMGVTSSPWKNLMDKRGKGIHPRIQPSEVGTAPRHDAHMCETSLKIPGLGACTDFACEACTNYQGAVQFAGHVGGAGNVEIADRHGVRQRAMTPDQYQEQWDAALANAMRIKQARENNLRNIFGESSQQ